MTIPSVQLRPGVKLDNAIPLLRELETNCHAAAQPAGSTVPVQKQLDYVRWATTAEGRLRTILPYQEAAAFFEGPRHRDICSMTPGDHLMPMISAEVNNHSARLKRLGDQLEEARRLFQGAGTCLVPDTSFYIENPEKLRDVDFHFLGQQPGAIRVLFPIVVIDELDGLKNRGSSKKTRWRAGYTLAVLNEVVSDPPLPGILQPGTHLPPRGTVMLQIVLDPPEHRRLPVNDDEIVDRCLACQPYTGTVTVVSYDTGQSSRARTAGLKVNDLRHELGPEP